MRCIRRHTKAGSWCALFALALQLMLSFGHVHPIGGNQLRGAPALLALAPGPPAALQDSRHPSGPGVPAGDVCPICALINLVGASVPPVVPVMAPAVVDSTPVAWPIAQSSLALLPRPHTQARAPPAA